MTDDKSCEFKNITTSINTLRILNLNISEIKSDIKKIKKKIKEFFDTTPIVVDFINLEIKDKDFIYEVYNFIKSEGFCPIGVKNIKEKFKNELKADKLIPVFADSAKSTPSTEQKTVEIIKEVIREIEVPIEIIKEVPIEVPVNNQSNETLKIFDIIRRGQKVINPKGDINVFAKVNYGSEIAAQGSIIVTDIMDGSVYAGVAIGDSEGDNTATIFIEKFNPMLVSINGFYKHFEKVPDDLKYKKVLISLKDEKLVFKKLEEGV